MLEFDNLWYFARTKLIDNLFRIHQSQKRSGKNQSKHFFFILSALSLVNILQTYRDNSNSGEIRQRITQRSSIFIEWIEWITMFQSRGKYLHLLVSIYPTHFQLPTDHPFGEKHSRECRPFPFLPSHSDTTSASSSQICGFGSTSGKTRPCCLYRRLCAQIKKKSRYFEILSSIWKSCQNYCQICQEIQIKQFSVLLSVTNVTITKPTTSPQTEVAFAGPMCSPHSLCVCVVRQSC